MAERLQLFTFSVRERISAAVGELLFLCDKVKVGEEVRDALSDKVIAAGGDVYREFERSVVNWESRRRRSEQEIRRLYRVLASILRPGVQLSRAVLPPELQQLPMCKEEVPPEQQEWSPSLGQEEPGPPHIKKEEEEFPVKTEHDVECAQWSQLHQNQTEVKREAETVACTSTEQMETEADGEDCGVSEAASSSDPAAALEPAGAEQLFSSPSSEIETKDSDEDWKETRQPQSVLPPELQQLSACKEELPPEQQEWSPKLGEEEPGPPHIKEEEEEFPVKTEHDVECAQWSQLHQNQTEVKREAEPVACTSTEQMETEGDGEDCGVSEAASSSDPAAALEPAGAEQLFSSHSSQTDTEDSDEDWKETRQPQSAVKTHGFSCPMQIKGSHTELYVRQLRSGEIRAESLLPSAASQPIRTSGTTRKQKDTPRHCCNQCDKSFLNSGNLKRHQHIHTGEKLYRCEQCGKRFSTNSYLKIHQRIHTGEKLYHCKQCGKRFNQSETLKTHQRIHTGDKPYHCDQCGKMFYTSGHLKIHQRRHTGEKPYHCELCGKKFSTSSDLKKHRRLHTGQKPYSCELCGKMFNTISGLKIHQSIHTGDKPYRCEQCGKLFNTSSSLKRHQSIHTGDKPYRCDQCGKMFKRSSHLKRHQRIHTGDK